MSALRKIEWDEAWKPTKSKIALVPLTWRLSTFGFLCIIIFFVTKEHNHAWERSFLYLSASGRQRWWERGKHIGTLRERETKEALRFTDTHSLSRSQWRVLEGGLRSPVWYKAEVAERVQAESLPRRWRAASLVTSCPILPVQRSSKRRVRAWLLEFAVQLAVSFCNRNMKKTRYG